MNYFPIEPLIGGLIQVLLIENLVFVAIEPLIGGLILYLI